MIRATAIADDLPIATVDARAALRIRNTLEDPILASKLRAAVELVEKRTGRTLRPTTFELTLDDWPADCDDGTIRLPKHPVREVLAVEYRDAAGAWVEVAGANYDWRRTAEGGELYFFTSYGFPSLSSDHRDRVRVRFEAGYEGDAGETGTGDDPELLLPASVREAVLLLAGHLFENRAASTTSETFVLPLGLEMVLKDLRIFR